MNLSSYSVELEQLYHIKQDSVESYRGELAGFRKLTLFNEASLASQKESIQALLSSLPECLLRCRDDNNNFLWDLYLDEAMLESFVHNQLKESMFDYLLWPSHSSETPKLLLFDMDSTFIEIEVIDELAKRHNVGAQVAEVTEAAMRGELDFAESLVSRVACLQGLSAQVIDDIAENLPVSAGVPHLVESAHKNGAKVSIVSGGFMPFVMKLKNSMLLHSVKANQLEISDNRLTGKVAGKIVDAKVKQTYLQDLCDSLGFETNQVMAIGDGANDLLMMGEAGFNLAYQAKPKVQAAAKGRINYTNLGRLAGVFDWS